MQPTQYEGDYIADALRTKSDQLHLQLVDEMYSSKVFDQLLHWGNELDKIKKAMFYGKGTPVAFSLADLPQIHTDRFKLHADLMHGIFGKVTEAIELLEALKPVLQGVKDIDKANVREEIGDGFWYDAILLNVIGSTFADAQTVNIAKLRARFPEKFTEQHAKERDLTKEREILEKGVDAAEK